MTIYTILVNSISKTAGSTTTNAFYNCDWSILPDNTKFKVGFTFVSDTVNITSYSSIALLSVVLGGVNTYSTSSSTTFTPISNLEGILAPLALSTTTVLMADADKNNKIWLQTRPKNNTFQVAITAHTGAFWVDNASAIPTNYVLILSFETVDD